MIKIVFYTYFYFTCCSLMESYIFHKRLIDTAKMLNDKLTFKSELISRISSLKYLIAESIVPSIMPIYHIIILVAKTCINIKEDDEDFKALVLSQLQLIEEENVKDE